MMEQRKLTCIGCPLGCQITVDIENGKPINVKGNTCKRGEIYACKEVTHPTRIVTSTITVCGGEIAMVPVKTKEDIPKEKIFEIMKDITSTKVKAPIEIGDVLINNVAGTGVDVVATKNVLIS